MAKQSKLGVCENCGDKGALTASFGRRVCSTCLKIRSNVNSHLEKVATAARDMGKGQELLAALVPDGGGMAIQDMEAELYADDTSLRDELARIAGAEVERLRDLAQESESRLIWYREALQVLRDRLGLDHLGEDEDVVERMLEAIASQAQALTRFQELARAADVRADHLEGELERQIGVNEAQAAVERELRATIAEQSADFERLRNQDLAGNGRYWSTDDSPLLDVALAVIRDEPVPADRIATLIDLARRASA